MNVIREDGCHSRGEVIDMSGLVRQEGPSDLARLSCSLIHSMRMQFNGHELCREPDDARESHHKHLNGHKPLKWQTGDCNERSTGI